jgi:hypothetical protein
MNCIICNKKVDWEYIKEEFSTIFDQVDAYGVDSLTEHEQCIYEGLVCSPDCFDMLK